MLNKLIFCFFLICLGSTSFAHDATIFDNVINSENAAKKWKSANSDRVRSEVIPENVVASSSNLHPGGLSGGDSKTYYQAGSGVGGNSGSQTVVSGGGSGATPYREEVVRRGVSAKNSSGAVDNLPVANGSAVVETPSDEDPRDVILHGVRDKQDVSLSGDRLSNLNFDPEENKTAIASANAMPPRRLEGESQDIMNSEVEDLKSPESAHPVMPAKNNVQPADVGGFTKNANVVPVSAQIPSNSSDSEYSVVGVYSKKDVLKDYYAEYIVGKHETIENVSKTFHVSISTFISAFAGYTDTTFIEGTVIMVPLLHHVRTGSETLEGISALHKVSTSEVEQINTIFQGKVDRSIVILPILDTSRKVIVHRYKDSSPKHVPVQHVSLEEDSIVPMPVKKPFSDVYQNPLESKINEDAPVVPAYEMVVLPVQRPASFAKEIASPVAVVPKADVKPKTSVPQLDSQSDEGAISAGAAFSNRFIWPLRGEVVTALTTATSRKSDGIEIRAKAGSNVHAAADGVVVYVGVNISMYSKLIIVKHKDEKITIYGHNSHVFVKKGDAVVQGQVISKIGKTDNVKNPKLYFAIRHGRKVLDPIKYLS